MIDINELYRNRSGTQLKVLYRYTKDWDAAEDVLQESYLRAVKFLPTYNPEKASPATWFNMIMFNTLRSYKKGTMGEQTLIVDNDCNLVEEVADSLPLAKVQENFMLIAEEILLVRSESSREILNLTYLSGYRSDELCSALGVSQTKITSCCSRFKARLLEKYDISV